MVVIIGAGTNGLYLAHKLTQAGVTSLAIYDPRAGVYTRPARLNSLSFDRLAKELNQEIVPEGQLGHIKDAERALFTHIKKQNVPIENKAFVRFSDDPQQKGVIVVDEMGNEELVACNYIFDCTGSAREVIHELNEMITPQPFTFKQIVPEISVTNHLLAYVRMSIEDFEKISQVYLKPRLFDASADSLAYVTAMNKLRRFGWHEMSFPKCWGAEFGNNKVCLTFECPDKLPKELQSEWAQTVINAITNSDTIHFEQLPPSKKYAHKPRFNAFRVDPFVLEQTFFRIPGLYTVIPIGDSQIDTQFARAQGIRKGMDRVNKLIKYIDIRKGTIAYFDSANYSKAMKVELDEQIADTIAYYREREKHVTNWLYTAEHCYTEVIYQAKGQPEQLELYQGILKEISARIACFESRDMLANFYNSSGQIPVSKSAIPGLEQRLSQLHDLLVKSLTDLPHSFYRERASALDSLKQVSDIWKTLGNYFLKENMYINAVTMYEHAITAYQHPLHTDTHLVNELTLYSNLVLCQLKSYQYDNAIKTGKSAINKHPDNIHLLSFKKNIMLHLIQAAILELNTMPEHNQAAFKQEINEFAANNPELMTPALQQDIDKYFSVPAALAAEPVQEALSVRPGFFHRRAPSSFSMDEMATSSSEALAAVF